MSTSKRGIDNLTGNQPTTNQPPTQTTNQSSSTRSQANYTGGRESSPDFPRRSTSLRERGFSGQDPNAWSVNATDPERSGRHNRYEDRGDWGRRDRGFSGEQDYSAGRYGSSGYGGQGRFGGGSYGAERGGPQQYGYGRQSESDRYFDEERERNYGRTTATGGYGHSGEYGRYSGDRERQESYRPDESYRGGSSRTEDYDRNWEGRGSERQGSRERYGREDYGSRDRDYDVEDVPIYGRDRSAFDRYGISRRNEPQRERSSGQQYETSREYGRPQLRCRDIMTKDVTACSPQTLLRDVAELMDGENVGSLPVVENGRVIGIVTDRDIVCRVLAEGRDTRNVTATEAMSDDLITCTPEETVLDCIHKMGEHQVRRMLVVDHGGRLRGIISLADIALEAERDRDLGRALEEISQPTPQQSKRR